MFNGKNMDKFIQEVVHDLIEVYNGKIPIQEIIIELSKKKKDHVKNSKNIDLSNCYEKIRALIISKTLISKELLKKSKVFIDRTNSRKREEGLLIIEPVHAS